MVYLRWRWPSGTVPDFATARTRVRLPPGAALHQRQLDVPSIRGRLMSTSESWGVNGHTTRCTSSVSVVLRLRLVSGWELVNGDQRRPMGPWGSGKDFTFLFKVALTEGGCAKRPLLVLLLKRTADLRTKSSVATDHELAPCCPVERYKYPLVVHQCRVPIVIIVSTQSVRRRRISLFPAADWHVLARSRPLLRWIVNDYGTRHRTSTVQ